MLSIAPRAACSDSVTVRPQVLLMVTQSMAYLHQ